MKILTVCMPDMHWFLDGVESVFRRRHEVRRIDTGRKSDISSGLAWADVVWCEFANESAAYVSSVRKRGVVVRMHSYEAYQDVARVTWDNVTTLVFTAMHVLRLAHETEPRVLAPRSVFIPSGVDASRFAFQPRKNGGTRIGAVAWVRPEKNPYAWLQILAALPPEYTLDVAGHADHAGVRAYLPHIAAEMGISGERLRFLGHVEDMPAFWAEHDICLSASTREGCPYNVLEAMSCGVRPVVHNYLGARAQFPDDAVWNTIDEACAMIAADREPDDGGHRWRALVEERYSLDAQANSLLAVVEAACPT